MKVGIDDSYQFTSFFESKLKEFLKNEFIKVIGMEVPNLWVPGMQKKTFNEDENITSIKDFRLSWYSGGSIPLKHLSWKSASLKNYTGKEELEKDDVEIWQEGLDHWIKMLRESIPPMFRKQFWLGYRFIVEVQGMSMDTLLTIDAKKDNFELITSFLEESVQKWNQSGDGLIHGIFPIKSRSNKLKIRIDTGSSGEAGIKAIINDLNNSTIEVLKIIIS